MLAAQSSQAAEARRSLLERFRVSDATRQSRARTLSELGIERTSALEDLVRQGAVREGTPGTFYLDEPTVAALERAAPTRSRQATRAVLIVLAILLLLPLVMLLVLGAVG